MLTVPVSLGDRSYAVTVGRGAREALVESLPPMVKRVAVVTQEGIPSALIPSFGDIPITVYHIGVGEESKTISTIEALCSAFARDGLTRNDVVVGVGGGMVTDVAGFAASVYHRGLNVMHVATSLLAMVDAAIGGKTGVNIPEGKNLIGAYWQPIAVACDLDALDTLPSREMRCGLGEMAKYHFIAHEDLTSLPLEARVARCVAIKGEIVESDERESGRRALLNYGHTLAHALEIETNFEMAHGEAVATGLLYAAHLAHTMGRISAERVEEHYRVVRGVYDLPGAIPGGMDPEKLLVHMAKDKKALSSLTFVLDSADGLEVVSGVANDDVVKAFRDFETRSSTVKP